MECGLNENLPLSGNVFDPENTELNKCKNTS
jgi:hypothetical protein